MSLRALTVSLGSGNAVFVYDGIALSKASYGRTCVTLGWRKKHATVIVCGIPFPTPPPSEGGLIRRTRTKRIFCAEVRRRFEDHGQVSLMWRKKGEVREASGLLVRVNLEDYREGGSGGVWRKGGLKHVCTGDLVGVRHLNPRPNKTGNYDTDHLVVLAPGESLSVYPCGGGEWTLSCVDANKYTLEFSLVATSASVPHLRDVSRRAGNV